MKESVNQSILQASLQVSGPRRELLIASLGCLMGTSLLLLGIQFYQDADAYLEQSQGPKNYFTLNKKVSGGALVNLGKNDQNFGPDELLEIRQTEGVRRLGGFSRNQFPVTVYNRHGTAWGLRPRRICSSNPFPMNFLILFRPIGNGRRTLPSCPSWCLSFTLIFGTSGSLHRESNIPRYPQRQPRGCPSKSLSAKAERRP